MLSSFYQFWLVVLVAMEHRKIALGKNIISFFLLLFLTKKSLISNGI